jgi:hypothetical protein
LAASLAQREPSRERVSIREPRRLEHSEIAEGEGKGAPIVVEYANICRANWEEI